MEQDLGETSRAPRGRRLAELFICFIVLLMAAAASFNGFYDKWGFRDEMHRFPAERMLDGTAARPFVYRQLNAWITNAIADATPASLEVKLQKIATIKPGKSYLGPDRVASASPDWFWRYTVLYYVTFAEWLAATIVLAALCTRHVGLVSGMAASVLFALTFPFLLSKGGYFYDFPEVLFFAAAVYSASRGWLIPLAILAVVGAMNKETMVFFLPTLLPFLAARIGAWKALFALGGCTLAAAATYLMISTHYAGNGGGRVEFHLLNNLAFYANPLNLLALEETYGLPLFRAYSIVGVAFVGILAISGWRGAPRPVRHHLLLALLVNLPLFAALAFQAEIRNLSLTFVGWTILVAYAIRRWLVDPKNSEVSSPAGAH